MLLALLSLGFALICARLGVWQLDRLAQRRTANAAALARRALPELALPAALPPEAISGRPARASGHYDPAREIVLRGQVFGGVPGIVLVTPLRLDRAGDTAVLVERGFVPSPDAFTVPADSALDEPGQREVHGLAMAIAESADAQPLERGGRLSLRTLDLAEVRSRLPYPVLSVLLLQAPDTSRSAFPRRRPLPPLDEGPHRLYAIQWFAFALIALVFAGVFLRQRTSRGTEGPVGGGPPAA